LLDTSEKGNDSEDDDRDENDIYVGPKNIECPLIFDFSNYDLNIEEIKSDEFNIFSKKQTF